MIRRPDVERFILNKNLRISPIKNYKSNFQFSPQPDINYGYGPEDYFSTNHLSTFGTKSCNEIPYSLSFDRNGSLERAVGNFRTCTYQHLEDGSLIETDFDEISKQIRIREYDQYLNRISSKNTSTMKVTKEKGRVVTRNENGLPTLEKYYKGKNRDEPWFTVTYEYNDKGEIIQKYNISVDGTNTSRISYSYTKNEIKEHKYLYTISSNPTEYLEDENLYSDNGIIKKNRYKHGSESYLSKEFMHDENQRVIEIREGTSQNDFYDYVLKFSYGDIDQFGNWKSVACSLYENKSLELVSTTNYFQNIVYWGEEEAEDSNWWKSVRTFFGLKS